MGLLLDNLNSEFEIMQVDDILNMIGIQGILFYFFIPTIIVALIGYSIHRLNLKNKRKAAERKEKEAKQKELKEKQKEAQEVLKDEKKATAILDTTPYEPDNLEKFSGLALEFDEDGYVKGNNNDKNS